MIKRLTREVAELQKGSLQDMGIYTQFDETNLRHGKALMIGPAGTPYAFCPLLFKITVPEDYPLVPPRVVIETSDGETRFHPNLYVNGKVCLSILGTYSGPSWVSTMNIETVLKSIYSLLNENPITNEPGWERYTLEDPRAKAYAEYVQYALLRHTLVEFTKFRAAAPVGAETLWTPFADVIQGTWVPKFLPRISEFVGAQEGLKTYRGLFYGMDGSANWERLKGLLAQN